MRRGRAGRTIASAPALSVLAVLVLLASGLLWSVPTAASAHYVGPTVVVVSTASGTGPATLDLDVQVPLPNLDFAYRTHLDADPVAAVDQQQAWLRSLVAGRVALVGADGVPWTVTVGDLTGATASPENVLHVSLTATAPPGPRPGEVDLRWAVVSDIVYSDKAYVSRTGSDGSVDLVGVLTHQQPSLRLTVEPAATHVSFGQMLRVGANHFREGVDHQLFLCLLAVGAACRRAPLRQRVRQLALLTLCFTLGHSVSLAAATAGGVDLPARWVETCIALTIVAAAVHTIRPRLGGRTELVLTVAFGLVHGFGFAGTLQDMSLRGRELAVPLLGFNLGLELAQLGALALIALPVWLISRSRPTTWAVTGVVALVAASWVVQRALEISNPVDRLVNAALATPEWLAVVLLVAALPHLLHQRLRRGRRTSLLVRPRRSAEPQPTHNRRP